MMKKMTIVYHSSRNWQRRIDKISEGTSVPSFFYVKATENRDAADLVGDCVY